MLQVIDKIEIKNVERPDKYFFNEGAPAMDILDFEAEYDIELPYFHKVFLNRLDGGFISQIKVSNSTELETAAWNSINLFSLSEIEEAYLDLSLRNWKIIGPAPEIYPFIPFARTAIGELLIFVNPLDKYNECPVFDAFHEDPSEDWGCLYTDFSLFLADYVKNDGVLKTISYEHPTVTEYMKKQLKEN